MAGSRYRVAYGYSYGWLKTASAGSRVLWSALAREEWGPVKLALLGNGLYVRREYDADTARLEIEHVAADPNGVGHQRLFEYYLDGALKSRTLPQQDRIDSLTYDDLNRLHTWSVLAGGSTQSNRYDYDDIGNLVTFTGAPGKLPTTTFVHGENGAGPLLPSRVEAGAQGLFAPPSRWRTTRARAGRPQASSPMHV